MFCILVVRPRGPLTVIAPQVDTLRANGCRGMWGVRVRFECDRSTAHVTRVSRQLLGTVLGRGAGTVDSARDTTSEAEMQRVRAWQHTTCSPVAYNALAATKKAMGTRRGHRMDELGLSESVHVSRMAGTHRPEHPGGGASQAESHI
jgi:hypothetical protein